MPYLKQRSTFMKSLFLLVFTLFLLLTNSSFAQRTAAEFFEDGNTKAAKGDFSGAVQAYSSVISLSPQHAPSLFNRGLAKANLKDHRGAILDYDQAQSSHVLSKPGC